MRALYVYKHASRSRFSVGAAGQTGNDRLSACNKANNNNVNSKSCGRPHVYNSFTPLQRHLHMSILIVINFSYYSAKHMQFSTSIFHLYRFNSAANTYT